MAFESLSEKFQKIFSGLKGKGKLTEADVKAAMREVRMALLEADVSFKVVKQFVAAVQERAIGEDIMNGLNPGQMVIKIVNEEMIRLMGSEGAELKLRPASEITVIMLLMYCIVNIEMSIKSMSARKELALAAEIQQSVLPNVFPPFPEKKEIDLHVRHIGPEQLRHIRCLVQRQRFVPMLSVPEV